MEPHKTTLNSDWPDLPPWWLVSTTRAAVILGLSPQTLLRWKDRELGPRRIPKSYLKPTKGDPIYYRYFDIKASAGERFGYQLSFCDDVVGFIARNCPKFSLELPANALAGQFDWYYSTDYKSLRWRRKLRYFDEDFIMRFEDIYTAQPKRTQLGIAKDDLQDRLASVPTAAERRGAESLRRGGGGSFAPPPQS